MKMRVMWTMMLVAGMILAITGTAGAGGVIHYWNFDATTGTGSPPTGTTATDVSFPDLAINYNPLAPTAAVMIPVEGNATSYAVILGHDGLPSNSAVHIVSSGGFTTLGSANPLYTVPTNFTFVGWVRWDAIGWNDNNSPITQRSGPMDIYNNPPNTMDVVANGVTLSGPWTRVSQQWLFVTVTGDTGTQKLTASQTSTGQAALGNVTPFTSSATAYNPAGSVTAACPFGLGTTNDSGQDKYTSYAYWDMAAIYDTVLTPQQLFGVYQNGIVSTTGSVIIENYNDLLNDGDYFGDPPLGGWSFNIQGVGVVTDNVGLDENPALGTIKVSGLSIGVHTISEVTQPGWAQTLGPSSFNVVGGTASYVRFANSEQPIAVPEPASLGLVGIVFLSLVRRRRG